MQQLRPKNLKLGVILGLEHPEVQSFQGSGFFWATGGFFFDDEGFFGGRQVGSFWTTGEAALESVCGSFLTTSGVVWTTGTCSRSKDASFVK